MPLTPMEEEHEKKLEVLRNMKEEEDIDTDDIPKADFTDADYYNSEIRPKNR